MSQKFLNVLCFVFSLGITALYSSDAVRDAKKIFEESAIARFQSTGLPFFNELFEQVWIDLESRCLSEQFAKDLLDNADRIKKYNMNPMLNGLELSDVCLYADFIFIARAIGAMKGKCELKYNIKNKDEFLRMYRLAKKNHTARFSRVDIYNDLPFITYFIEEMGREKSKLDLDGGALQIDSNNPEFQAFLQFVDQNSDAPVNFDFVKYDALSKLLTSRSYELFSAELLAYSLEVFRKIYDGPMSRSVEGRLQNELTDLKKLRKAIDSGDRLAVKRIEKERCPNGLVSDDVDVRFACMYPLSKELLNLCVYYEKTYNALREKSIVETIPDFVTLFRYVEQYSTQKYESLMAGQTALQYVLSFYPRGTAQHIARVKNLKVMRLQELEDQKKRVEAEEIERRKQEIDAARELKQKSILVKNFAKKVNHEHGRLRFVEWMHCAQDGLEAKRAVLSGYFYAFKKAIDQKVKAKKEVFIQEVVEPNANHGKLIEQVRAQRAQLPDVQEPEPVVIHDVKANVVASRDEQGSLTQKELMRQARIARRIKRQPGKLWWQAHLKDEYDKYVPCDLAKGVQERNSVQEMKMVVEQSILQRFFTLWHIHNDDKKVTIAQQLAEQERLTRRAAALSSPSAWRHSPYGHSVIGSPVASVGGSQPENFEDVSVGDLTASTNSSSLKVRQNNPYGYKAIGS